MTARLLAAALLAAAGAVHGASPSVSDVVVSEAKDGPAKSLFKPTTPKVHLRAKLADVAPGTKVKAEWIAVRAEGAPPGYKIDTVESTAGAGASRYDGALGKPSAGWPVGEYRVDIYLGGKPAGGAAFKVAR